MTNPHPVRLGVEPLEDRITPTTLPQLVAAPSDPATFVDGTYQQLLHRPADPGGMANWQAKLGAGESRAAVAAAVMASAEFESKHSDWVGGVFVEALGRAGDPAGHASASARAIAGTPRDVLIRTTFLASPEFLTLVYAALPTATATASVGPIFIAPSNTDFVNGLFRIGLNRSADASGMADILGKLNAGQSRFQVAASVFSSPEFFSTHGDWVSSLYANALVRFPDLPGFIDFSQRVINGASRQGIAAGFFASPEFNFTITHPPHDLTPPHVISVASTGPNTVVVTFSEAVADSALSASAFAVARAGSFGADALAVSGVRFINPVHNAVELTTQTQGAFPYFVSASAFADLFGNATASASAFFFGTPGAGAGVL